MNNTRIIYLILGLAILAGSLYWVWHDGEMAGIKGRSDVVQGENHLKYEKSPYLLQHKDNPVHWYAWGEEAFEAAKKQGKVIFLSIGYSTCHWCHVMEEDSFERQEVADVLNRHFISIKVDREERPDVDQIYMDAVVAMIGQGGWPMSVFLTPDLKPFFGGTFFWRPQFVELLNKVQDAWTNQRDKLEGAGNDMVAHLSVRQSSKNPFELDEDALRQAFEMFSRNFDGIHGGFGGAPKFPRSIDLSLLLRIHRRTGSQKALEMVKLTLDQMARGGMYDHLGGGFHRYSTDEEWLTPHFEKMLYDNALLAWTYLEAYQVTGSQMYASVAREILDYILRDMTHPEGGFYSAEDADSEGEEGKFYVWKMSELQSLLTQEELDLFVKIYGVSGEGNFEHGMNILHLTKNYEWSDKSNGMIVSAHQKLFRVREKRIHPYKDDKILTSWNGLMIAAMAKASQVLGEEGYLSAARKAAQFIKKELYKKGELLGRFRDGESRFRGNLNDYTYLIHGLLVLFEADQDGEWISWVLDLQKTLDRMFWDHEAGAYFFSAEGTKDLIIRNKELNDGATPSGNGVAILNLLRLYALTFEKGYLDHARQSLKVASGPLSYYPPGFAMTLIALDYLLDRSKEIAVIGDSKAEATKSLMKYLGEIFLPNLVYAFGESEKKSDLPLLRGREAIEDDTTVYVCENNICKLPTRDIEQAKKMILDFEKYQL